MLDINHFVEYDLAAVIRFRTPRCIVSNLNLKFNHECALSYSAQTDMKKAFYVRKSEVRIISKIFFHYWKESELNGKQTSPNHEYELNTLHHDNDFMCST